MSLSKWRFCPHCANPLIWEERYGDRRPICEACERVYFADPKVTVAVLIEREGKVLLGRRAMNPGIGLWCLPGGFVDYGEAVREAAYREALEETALRVTIGELLGVEDWDDEESDKKGVAIFFRASAQKAEVVADDDMLELGWFTGDDLPPIAFASHEAIVKQSVCSVYKMIST